jgi:hypothetical protein
VSSVDVDFRIADEIDADPSGRTALRYQLLALAHDVGMLRRRFASNETAWTGRYIADSIADHVEILDRMVGLSAGELAACWAPGDDEAVEEAIRIVDERWRQLQYRLGSRAA